jgi:peptidyl-prolyl cis-trans isomerase SurA
MKVLITLVIIISSVFALNAQDNEKTLLTIGDKKVSLSEFEAIYSKNNSKEKSTQESINEYLELYIKFKLKVSEAEELGYDTTSTFKNELRGYRSQLAQPYLTDKEVTESLIKEAYDRMKTDVKASHILVKVDIDADPKDTLAAYTKIMNARKRVIKGEPFENVAKAVSTDPSVKDNGGNLGYFSAFHMVYPFESAGYNTKVGEISMPIRTSFGYHIIKVVDKRTSKGTIKVAHIMVRAEKKTKGVNQDAKKKKIDEIYNKLINESGDFAALARQFSDDKGSAVRAGELPEFVAGKMVEEFENAAFALKSDGDISKPVQTAYGWHIIKRLKLKGLASYDDIYTTIKAKVARDSRSNKSKDVVINKIKKENNFKENIKERNDFYVAIKADEYYDKKWAADMVKGLDKVMFGFYAEDGDKLELTQTEFALRLQRSSLKRAKRTSMKTVVNKAYTKAIEDLAIQFKDSRLSRTSQEFRLLMQEYRDGILLFNLTDEKVWSKAIKDSAGLADFYEKNKSKYMWDERVQATIYTCNNETVAQELNKLLKKKGKKAYTNDDILKMINVDSQLALKIEEGKFDKKSNEVVAKATWTKGVTSTIKEIENVVIVVVDEVLKPEPKLLSEIKGLITSDYQNYLEKEWVAHLKSKYKVVVNKEVLKLVK